MPYVSAEFRVGDNMECRVDGGAGPAIRGGRCIPRWWARRGMKHITNLCEFAAIALMFSGVRNRVVVAAQGSVACGAQSPVIPR